MDPSKIKLTTLQKIKPLLKAIDMEIPWQIVVVLIICTAAWVFGSATIPIIIASSAIADFILRRIIIGFVMAIVAFLISGLIYMVVEEKILPLADKIRGHYKVESLITKKEILDRAEEEMLRK